VHQTGIDRWPGRSILPSGSRPAFAGQFTCTLLVWIGSVHGIALGYCLLPTQPCVCFVKLKESFIVNRLVRFRGGKPEKHALVLSLTAFDPERLEAWYDPSIA